MSKWSTVRDALGLYSKNYLGDKLMAKCPAHDDRTASLSVAEGDDGKILIFCHAGCATADIVSALGLEWKDLFQGDSGDRLVVARYVYTDEKGSPTIRVTRYEPKSFAQQHWAERWSWGVPDSFPHHPYNLPSVVSARDVYIVEGEKDADNLQTYLGDDETAVTTFVGGCGKWRPEYARWFEGRRVRIIADNDEPGRIGAQKIAAEIPGAEVLVPRFGKDVSDMVLVGKFEVEPLDDLSAFDPWDPWEYEAPVDEWLFKPYVPRRSRILLHGESGALKTLWAQWLAVRLAQRGERVAFFSTEMNKGQAAKRFQRFARPERLRVFGRFILGADLQALIRCFEGYDLIIVDSWSSAQGDMSSNDNDAVSRLDKEFLEPLIAATGASIMLIDNTGKPARDSEGRKVKSDMARGASRKRDIQEVELWFERPDPENNFRTRIHQTKQRLDIPQAGSKTIETPQDDINFYYVENSSMSRKPFWPDDEVDVDEGGRQSQTGENPTNDGGPEVAPSSLSLSERLRLARLQKILGAIPEHVLDEAPE